jgi:hypothetical protein
MAVGDEQFVSLTQGASLFLGRDKFSSTAKVYKKTWNMA